MKFTHRLFTGEGWGETSEIPSDYKEIKHLGKCDIDGDMFASYDSDGLIHIFKGVLEEELKTDTWYRDKYGSSLVYRTGNQGNYGIYINREYNDLTCSTPEIWQEATEEEVKEVLVKLAKKKGFKNIHELRLKLINGKVFKKGDFDFEGNKFVFETNMLLLDDVVIFRNGEWAEIIEKEQPLTILGIEERLKRLEDKLL